MIDKLTFISDTISQKKGFFARRGKKIIGIQNIQGLKINVIIPSFNFWF